MAECKKEFKCTPELELKRKFVKEGQKKDQDRKSKDKRQQRKKTKIRSKDKKKASSIQRIQFKDIIYSFSFDCMCIQCERIRIYSMKSLLAIPSL